MRKYLIKNKEYTKHIIDTEISATINRFLTRIYESIDPTASKVARPEIIIAPDIDLPSFSYKECMFRTRRFYWRYKQDRFI